MVCSLWVAGRATPGHDCPGLIEAEIKAPNHGAFARPTPGHDCPGLIEAAARCRLRPPRIAPLRGMIAPASLKLALRLPSTIHHVLATPGHDCPGLIEASRSHGNLSAFVLSPLRGMIAPASLKPARPLATGALPARTTPGHDCPGLIEARDLERGGRARHYHHSGA